MLAVGEHLWGQVDDQTLRISSGLAGGVGGSQQELCGALSGGVLMIGALYGRTHVDQDDEECGRLVSIYRNRFIHAFGTTCCHELRDSGYGSDGQWPCSTLVERATRILMEVLDGATG